MQKKKSPRTMRLLGAALLFLSALALLATRWVLTTWQHLSMDELVYHLTTSLSGADRGMILDFAVQCLLPALAVALLGGIVFKRRAALCGLIALICALLGSFGWLNARLQMMDYLRAQGENSDFIAQHYADPDKTVLAFPENKRNLIYIFLESMETTYADAGSGGAMATNLIPNLTALAQAHEDFSGDSALLNGAHSLYGSTWTMGAMFAHTAGLPLKVSVEGNSMGEQAHFFPELVTLGDVLQEAGYSQTLLIGSDVQFGGRDLYYRNHGDFDLRDHTFAQENGWIDDKYFVFWGYEDEKLFSFAREEVMRLSAQDAPFHLSILTVDTHFEDGYICARCGQTEGEPYANVILCSDCQVAEFVAWLQAQPCYADTAVVLVGDHLTMDSDFCRDVAADYDRRVYTAFLNAACNAADPALRRQYSTFDLFPTTLAALGVEIAGNRLGLGVNLFSHEKTLLETYDAAELNAELRKNSLFMQEKARLFVMQLSQYNPLENTMQLYAEGLNLVDETAVRVEAVINGEAQTLYEEKTAGKRVLSATISLPNALPGDMEMIISYIDRDGAATQGGGFKGHPITQTVNTLSYLHTLSQMKDCSLLFAVKDDAGKRMTVDILSGLRKLGLTQDLTGQYRAAYCAVITGGEVEEELDHKPLKMNGKLHDGVKYRLMSAGFDTGNRVSIRVDNEEYAADYRGLNLVVYDHKTQTVIDSLSIDTGEDGDIKRREE